MIIETSAIIAILRDESEAMSCAQAISDAMTRRVSAVNYVESAVVIDASHDPIAKRRFDDFIREANISIEPVTEVQAQIARAAGCQIPSGRIPKVGPLVGTLISNRLSPKCTST